VTKKIVKPIVKLTIKPKKAAAKKVLAITKPVLVAKVAAPKAKPINKTTTTVVVKSNIVANQPKATTAKPLANKPTETKALSAKTIEKKEHKKTPTPKVPTHNYIKYEMEFPMHASRNSIFNFVTDASALSAWFADNVNLVNEEYVFTWDGVPQTAKVIYWKESQTVRYHWLHEPEGTYFEFNIVEDELTSDLALMVTDFSEDAGSIEASRRLWQSQIADLHHVIGG